MRLLVVLFLIISTKLSHCCVATRSASATVSACQTCSSTTTTIFSDAESKDFTSDVIDTSGTCATRTFVCDGTTTDDEALITFNPTTDGSDDDGTLTEGSTTTTTLTCNSNGQWVLSGVVITTIQCQST